MRAQQPGAPIRRAAAALAVAAAVAAIVAPEADAGTYVAVQCHPEFDLSAGNAVFSRTSDHYLSGSGCAGTGPGMQIRNSAETTKDQRFGAWTWKPPAGTQFTQVTSQAHVGHDAGHKGFVTITDAAGTVHWRWPAQGSWQPVEWGAGSAAVAFTAWLRCYGDGGSCERSSSAHTYLRRLWFTLRDTSAPSLALRGSLFEDGPRRGPQSAELLSSDVGGGVWRWLLTVNGVQVAAAEAGCDIVRGGPARRFVPCPSSASRDFSLDTESKPFRDGANSVRACVADVGWPGNQVCATREVRVDNSCPSSGTATPTVLQASFANGRSEATTAFNRRATVRGRLASLGGGNPGEATICVFSRVSGRPESLEARVRAGEGGQFAFPVLRGPSRVLRLVQRHRSVQVERLLSLGVRARPRLKVGPRSRLRNGQTARFRGKLPGPGAAGRVVALQARIGSRWQTFETARTDAEGRFAASYRFRETTGRRLYRFRAVVREQAGYPYMKGASPLRRVVVSG